MSRQIPRRTIPARMHHSSTGPDQPRDDPELHCREGIGAPAIVLIRITDCGPTLQPLDIRRLRVTWFGIVCDTTGWQEEECEALSTT